MSMAAICSDCVKKKVCNQQEFAELLEREVVNIKVAVGNTGVYNMSTLRSNFGLTAEPKCCEKLKDERYDYDSR